MGTVLQVSVLIRHRNGFLSSFSSSRHTGPWGKINKWESNESVSLSFLFQPRDISTITRTELHQQPECNSAKVFTLKSLIRSKLSQPAQQSSCQGNVSSADVIPLRTNAQIRAPENKRWEAKEIGIQTFGVTTYHAADTHKVWSLTKVNFTYILNLYT